MAVDLGMCKYFLSAVDIEHNISEQSPDFF